ncbi:unnamed protein product [Caenorhabditis angaria]|uniref:GATOR1 complex protein NPRL3 C-terminal HTH domain-containing protein n=1 Tax=Caenorhabditis angaria TaxID=860376 RepID=A0A9P1IP24_9PELO|nr:unnamed protein product [Caenorhabditis angaria]
MTFDGFFVLHQFCYIIKPYSIADCPQDDESREFPSDLQEMIETSCIDKSVQPIVRNICGKLLADGQGVAQVETKLSIFISMAPLMDGNHHMEDIKYQTNLKRSLIEEVLETFQLVIAKFLRPDFVAE